MTKEHIRQLQLAMSYQNAGRLADAIKVCEALVGETPNSFERVYLLAMLYARHENFSAAADMFRHSVKLKPQFVDAQYNLAVALSMNGAHDEAEETFKRVFEMNPKHANARNNYAALLLKAGRVSEAARQYDELIALNPSNADAYSNRGTARQALRLFEEALLDYDKAIALRSNFAEAYVNRGNVLADLDRPDDALASYKRALVFKPDFADVYNNIGNVYYNGRHYEQAIAAFGKVLALGADDRDARSLRLSAKMQLCDWSNLDAELADLLKAVRNRQPFRISGEVLEITDGVAPGKSAPPSVIARLTDDPMVILASTVNWLREHVGNPTSFTHVRRPRNGKIRLGYISQDFRNHVTGLSSVEMFEKHDKSRFELFGFSLARDDGSTTHRRIATAFDHFYDLSALADEAAAKRIYEAGLDILAELVPHSLGSRPAILAYRPAPIQVHALPMGYSAGAPFIDYILADQWMLPFAQQPFYLEKIVHLPHTYFAYDSTQQVSEHTPTRTETDLPEEGFVFCCFNASYKIFPQFFEIWMRLLDEIKGSVLWLARHNDIVVTNLRREAGKRGINPARLIFAERLPAMADHLARHRLADLFLDTLPYNAQVTAMDALWAGLPVLTCSGRSYAGRIATSQLHGIELPELVAENIGTYERLALALARDPQRLQQLKAKLAANRYRTPLFDMARLCHETEAAYATMVDIWQQGEHPRSFSVELT